MDGSRPPTQSEIISELVESLLITKLNRVIAAHFPVGQVNYREVLSCLMALASAYAKELERFAPEDMDSLEREAQTFLRLAAEAR